ncbi:hypothetical protein CROQUDRAFT_413517 [Cronartium quercuum f. sp. fusiforme G11]|uniref:Uncharacterized protein n=1 Tax=Cronartium quercuum f. sp. fusiforme G11 TaxID=708437 RepID=A0A9P6N5R6_9BASI|nr:hypothetical protein CROQUDRAFT_413517 [Cronartium quercuum f. sp. fusiforme G11]
MAHSPPALPHSPHEALTQSSPPQFLNHKLNPQSLPPQLVSAGGFRPTRKPLTSKQEAALRRLIPEVEHRCQTDPDWNSERVWLLGDPTDLNSCGILYALIHSNRYNVLGLLAKGVARRRKEATDRGEAPSTAVLARSPMPGCRADGAASTRSTSNSPSSHKRHQGHSPDVSNSNAQPASTCNARPEEPLTTSDTSPPPDAALLNSLIPRLTSHQSLEVGTLVVSHQQQITVEPQITGHFLIWALSASESNKETRSPVSSIDILHLPPIIVDSLAEKYTAYKFHDYLLHLLKDRSLPKSDVLVQRCHMLKLSVYQPWENHKERFIQARVRFNLVRKGSAQPDLNIRPLWLPFRDLAHAQQKAREIDRKAMDCALTFCEDASARARLSNLTPGIPFEPSIWAHQFCESHCPVKSFRPTPPPMAGRCRPTLRITTGNSSPASVKAPIPYTVNQSDYKLPSSSGDSALLDPPIHHTHDQVEDRTALNKAGASVVSSQTTKTPNVIARSISTAPTLVPIPSHPDKSDLAAAQIGSSTEQLSHLSSSNVSSASRDPTQALKPQSVEDQNMDVFSLPTPTADPHTGPLPVQSSTEAALTNSSNALDPMSAGTSAIDSSLFSTQSGIQAGSSASLSQPSKQIVLETVAGNAKCEKRCETVA